MPDLVTALIPAPVKPPCRTSIGEITTWNSWMASSEIGLAPACPPGVPLAARPKRSLLTAPSIWIEL